MYLPGYIAGDLLIFEDFEKQGGMLQLLVKRQEKYEKTKFSLPLDEISSVYSVTRLSAMNAVKSDKSPGDTRRAAGITKILNRTVTQILMKDGSACYFELIDEKAFRSFINK